MSMRLSYMLTAFALITPALMMSNTQDAEACSIAHFEESMPPEWSETNEFPANGIFYAEFEQRYHWVDEQGDPIELEEVMELNLPELLDIRRPVTPLTPGQKIMTEGCNHESCTWTIVEEDTTAPPTPRISEVEVYIDRQRRLERTRYVDSCGGGSGDNHSISFQLEFDEEIEDVDLHTIWLEFGADDGDIVYVMPPPTEDRVTRATAYQADGKTIYYSTSLSEQNQFLRPDAPFCFRAALMDAAGNVSQRSAEQCVDPTNRRAPYVSGPGACSIGALGAGPSAPSGIPLLGLAIGLVALGVRRREA